MNTTYWKLKMNSWEAPDVLIAADEAEFIKIFKFYEDWLLADDIWIEYDSGEKEFLPECKIVERLKNDIHSCAKICMSAYDSGGQLDSIVIISQISEDKILEKPICFDEFLERHFKE